MDWIKRIEGESRSKGKGKGKVKGRGKNNQDERITVVKRRECVA